ncbi:C4-dicarboxylate ABC transporter [Neisseria arctica]|uniref:C4-dicarboxylate transporter n=1 Tax=Neisseria arctica TaxID=1470200 RepID=A0A0J1C5V3_9NEIS|nr:anaerobic C4-dicarboxylate transporter [Neisseria arctica]KLT73733.1 C4-dicarboxylate ABC transporter [Neisseria arctica]UOO85871.1 anaerobic C4-dicarboxylate transporter [Neisseria arctica]
MDFSVCLQLAVLLAAIFLGVRLGGLAIGYTGGLGVAVLALALGMEPGKVPYDVILIIMSVISAIAALQLAGGLDYLVRSAERILRKNPKNINFLAPTVTYFLTILAGTGHTAFSMMPVIVEVAKGENIRPCAPLSIAVVASQIAITASPVSAAVVFMSGVLEPLGVSYPKLLLIWLVTTYAACMLVALLINLFGNLDLSQSKAYQQRLAAGLIQENNIPGERLPLPAGARKSVWIFFGGVVAVVMYACAISPAVGLIEKPVLPRDGAIISFMMIIATLVVMSCKLDTGKLLEMSTFKSGMAACICVLGVAWLGDTFVSGHLDAVKETASELVGSYPWLLAVALFFASMLLYSQAATAKAIIPAVILALGITPENNGQVYILVASFAAVSALFVLPTYPTLLGAVQMDDTGSTRIGRFVFNHSFLIPGILAIVFAVALGFLLAPLVL